VKSLLSRPNQVAENELAAAERSYKAAYDDGDSDAMVAAQRQIAQATLKLDKVSNMRPLQVQEKEVQIPQRLMLTTRAEEWRS
jgi:hypothetical protein